MVTAMGTSQNNYVLMSKTITLHVQYTFGYISLPSSAKQQHEMTSFKVFWGTGTQHGEFFFLFLNLYIVPMNSVPRQFGYIRQVKQVGIIAK